MSINRISVYAIVDYRFSQSVLTQGTKPLMYTFRTCAIEWQSLHRRHTDDKRRTATTENVARCDFTRGL